LGSCARAAATVLGLKPDEIMVTDVREDTMTLDILVPTIQAEDIVSRKEALLNALASIPGVSVTEKTDVHSEGILGLISLDKDSGRDVLKRTSQMGVEIEAKIRRRAIVFATGKEVIAGQIRDTNTPFLLESLRGLGYETNKGPVLEDRVETIARAFWEAAADGYGLVISTGGIGAEGKDQTLEALSRIDRYAILPYILMFQKGEGRHQKDGVRIGVGRLEMTRFVCLPGPHDEVELAWGALRKGLESRWGNEMLAKALADSLRQKFLDRGAITH
jgi:molybdenum cofactor synthesis domain-containing protein